MTPEQITLVRTSFAAVQPIAEQAAAMFYARLFELAPQLRPMFKGDLTEQGRKLMAMLATVVNTLDQPDVLVPAARRLGERHVTYHVKAAHYALVGTALLDTLAAALGERFTPATREAWQTAYGGLSTLMIAAAANLQGAAA